MGQGRCSADRLPGPTSIDDPRQLQHIARGAPASMTAGSVFRVRSDLSRLGHQKIQVVLRQFIKVLQLQFPVEQMAAKPFAVLFLGRDVSAQGASQRGCVILRLCRY